MTSAFKIGYSLDYVNVSSLSKQNQLENVKFSFVMLAIFLLNVKF